jgi:DNA-binding CsgD family transcriptional regulator
LPGAAIFLLEPDRLAPVDAELLAESFDLAPREAELVVLLAGGANLRRAAEQMGIGVGTARWYLKQALGKTGARRQVDLVRLAAGFASACSKFVDSRDASLQAANGDRWQGCPNGQPPPK